jgi:hypothetical protein
MKKIYDWYFQLMFGYTQDRYNFTDSLMFWFAALIAVIIVGLIIWIIYSAIDSITAHQEESEGIIIDKSHDPDTTSTNVGVGIVGGQTALLVTSSGSPESWHIIVRETSTNEVLKFDTTMQYLYDCKIGQKQRFVKKIGGISKSIISQSLENQ